MFSRSLAKPQRRERDGLVGTGINPLSTTSRRTTNQNPPEICAQKSDSRQDIGYEIHKNSAKTRENGVHFGAQRLAVKRVIDIVKEDDAMNKGI